MNSVNECIRFARIKKRNDWRSLQFADTIRRFFFLFTSRAAVFFLAEFQIHCPGSVVRSRFLIILCSRRTFSLNREFRIRLTCSGRCAESKNIDPL